MIDRFRNFIYVCQNKLILKLFYSSEKIMYILTLNRTTPSKQMSNYRLHFRAKSDLVTLKNIKSLMLIKIPVALNFIKTRSGLAQSLKYKQFTHSVI